MMLYSDARLTEFPFDRFPEWPILCRVGR